MIRSLFLAVVAVVTLATVEAVLRHVPPSRPVWALPEAITPPPGAAKAVRYLGNVEATDEHGFRLGQQVERPDVYAIGDSVTYGRGVAAEDAWPAVLWRTAGLAVSNLGRVGASTIDAAGALRRLPEARAVLYGVCPNDVTGPRQSCMDGPGRAWTDRYALTRRMGLATGQADCAARWYAARRADWLSEASRALWIARKAAQAPPYALVVTTPELGDGALVRALEADLGALGWRVVPATYLDTHAGETWGVANPWDGHTNARGHAAYARLFEAALREDGWLR